MEEWYDQIMIYPEASLFPKLLKRDYMLVQGCGGMRESYPSLVNKHFVMIDQWGQTV